ncbi:hypothetical protein A2697_01245 [Candidatus Curtissbacteria bacterium RIFCSPHIGHO2_01_FULL_41_44]|uniref:Uncharacterized protein n=1 Tax=Candidatus Curtissbacteria bacterium RIFCSPLOWO2_01_FULL_42_50 TaxID=1797730 RepID=A0A1F5H3F1_9BACT|nr:MAG: hypothetical protein A2697_01245 [Candidatus Curtissbacteria bacterium RIFCSPHIGHO2_01_FULL_41_44]OGD97919.1 MAG: hypothetical protein A3E71_03720 [Candidatus Curtissbacteria bacterium RIFCSPHIGHO2_12_FULL_42_33]OGD98567.1 MAG: hypothetical protein A3B54_05290 [Candidatus Curtissbacteria bacterium RIFCSPLOWO2_01_FULL_42_50]OGE11171.1 MAG: hypothetical protein A3H87_01365 [Candidatus Curtissbacteria bacterium RIFCSPLOWO2_02_FULL_42_37]
MAVDYLDEVAISEVFIGELQKKTGKDSSLSGILQLRQQQLEALRSKQETATRSLKGALSF